MAESACHDLSSSFEDYLEAIWTLTREQGAARVRDIAERVGVGQSAVSNALRALDERGLVDYQPYQLVKLTDAGVAAARQVDRRHRVLRTFLVDVLGLEEAQADRNACQIEHHIDPAVIKRLAELSEFLSPDARPGRDWARASAGKSTAGAKGGRA